MVKDTQTLFEKDRGGLTKNAWSQRKKKYRLNGLKQGDWHSIRPNDLNIDDVREGMTIQNTQHEHLIYRIVRTKGITGRPLTVRKGFNQGRRCILVIETKDIGTEKPPTKELMDLSRFRLLIP